jgi:hypothetical protein
MVDQVLVTKPRPRAGFTMLEAVACVLVFAVGLSAAIGMVIYGIELSGRAQAAATATATAMTVADDPAPLLSPEHQATWTTGAGTTTGYINGYYVVRREEEVDVVPAGGIKARWITVDVFDTFKGRKLASHAVHRVGGPGPSL